MSPSTAATAATATTGSTTPNASKAQQGKAKDKAKDKAKTKGVVADQKRKQSWMTMMVSLFTMIIITMSLGVAHLHVNRSIHGPLTVSSLSSSLTYDSLRESVRQSLHYLVDMKEQVMAMNRSESKAELISELKDVHKDVHKEKIKQEEETKRKEEETKQDAETKKATNSRGKLATMPTWAPTELSNGDHVAEEDKRALLKLLPSTQVTNTSEPTLAQHVLLYTDKEDAFDNSQLTYILPRQPLRKAIMVDDELLAKIFGLNTKIVCLSRGTPLSYTVDFFDSTTDASAETLPQWLTDKCTRAEIGFVSYAPKSLKIYWVRQDGTKVDNGDLKPGEKNTQWRWSFLGHHFIVEDPTSSQDTQDSGEVFPAHEFTVEYDGIHVVGEVPQVEAGKVTMPDDYMSRQRASEDRRMDKIKRTFTDIGFQKIPVPRRLWGSIQAYWNNNKLHRLREEWDGKGFFINWHEVDAHMVVPSWDRKNSWHRMFQPILEEWSQEKLEPTDLYGIRIYYDGAWLISHVDREDTHAVSAIINIEQGGIRENWDLEIMDIFGNMHNYSLQPGEAMLYESAKCLHGRPKPLQGDYYANVFFHYRPVGQPKWWKEERGVNDRRPPSDHSEL